jgi:RNA polymerase sigma-70 factor (ECF subfamily)
MGNQEMRDAGDVPSHVAHLFRHESGRLTATVARIFGLHNLALAEDVVQDAFFRALEVWKIRGLPDNPTAWLMTTARNRALDALRRERTVRTFAPELDQLLRSEWTAAPAVAEEFGDLRIKDDLLRMMFSCCNPVLGEPAQLAVILNILCGFTAAEIAAAFLSPQSAVEKRLARAKKSLAATPALFDIGDAGEFATRLPTVLRALYLLFNEGYHGSATRGAIQPELCHESMRLIDVLLAHSPGRTPAAFALAALMCFNAARLPARAGVGGELVALVHQDRACWDRPLTERGFALLGASAEGHAVSEYHIEAAIASVHAEASGFADTDWRRIRTLYDLLMTLNPSPVVALNRAIAVAQADGPERGLEELGALAVPKSFDSYPFYQATLGELKLRCGRYADARLHFEAALAVARNGMERRFLAERARACETR